MAWVKMLFREVDEVLVRCDSNGTPIKKKGRFEMKYNEGGSIYTPNPANISPIPGQDQKAKETKPKGKPSGVGKGPENRVIAYTDGACSGNPGPSGYGVVLRWGKNSREISEYLGKGTNNIAELSAILRAAKEIAQLGSEGVIFTDSSYSIGVLTQGWKAKANRALIAQTKKALAALEFVELKKVPGHAGVPDNELADQLAVDAVKRKSSLVVP